jgi:hypothetical protein
MTPLLIENEKLDRGNVQSHIVVVNEGFDTIL